MKNIIVSLLIVVILAGCTAQDAQLTSQMLRVGFSTSQIVETWDTNRATLQKYHDLLPVADPDRSEIERLIATGDIIAGEYDSLIHAEKIPSIATVKMLFKEADSCVQIGRHLFDKYNDSISGVDTFRAKVFADTWDDISRDVTALSDQSSGGSRYNVAKDLLSFAVLLTGQVVIPSLQAAGKI